ncbi:hypothetical protein ABIC78_002579 [Novosphingobium sp. 1529]|uniref:RES family NAD+ phosphorylase n=1 Tax=Novosphingobium sp. 1529 TaxID=3156424 RepID=UPI0033938DF1
MTDDHDEQRATEILLCAKCFQDRGLRHMARWFETEERSCPNCGAVSKHCLTRDDLLWLSKNFFEKGSTAFTDYGGAPTIVFNETQKGSLNPDPPLAADVDLLQNVLHIGFFHYGPRLWMIGNIAPLEHLQAAAQRPAVIERILESYPTVWLTDTEFYRVRKAPENPAEPNEYDAPPQRYLGNGRLDNADLPVLYGSQDAEICVHECRFMAGDELYIATLRPKRPLKLIDLSAILQEDCTEFESLDLGVLMLFLAQSHAYPISREIAQAVHARGFDGMIYPSYFSVLHTGGNPFDTVYGLSTRRFGQSRDFEKSKIIGNLAIFGRPVAEGLVAVVGVNRLIIDQVKYKMIFGPVTY